MISFCNHAPGSRGLPLPQASSRPDRWKIAAILIYRKASWHAVCSDWPVKPVPVPHIKPAGGTSREEAQKAGKIKFR
jgi:hypothetical protein